MIVIEAAALVVVTKSTNVLSKFFTPVFISQSLLGKGEGGLPLLSYYEESLSTSLLNNRKKAEQAQFPPSVESIISHLLL